MDLNAYTRTISTLFSTNVKYVVPRFQREYSWTKDEVSELWHDVVNNLKLEDNNIKNLEYFIGSLVLIGEDKSSELQIVDGQQRLTTITLLLSALVETFKSVGETDLAQGIYSTYIEGKDLKFKPFFKLENENPKPFLQESIQHITKKDNHRGDYPFLYLFSRTYCSPPDSISITFLRASAFLSYSSRE
ncbi:MAG: DUF262 domain-containing protein [Flavobacteriales bacterium]|nr:DUF262 domain-containing protein [Flavobacteriales bacterium]